MEVRLNHVDPPAYVPEVIDLTNNKDDVVEVGSGCVTIFDIV